MEREKLFEVARRTFDTPEFRGIEFIEVEAKSVINHVPGNFLPFKWTINPYRGCSHACVYCFARVTHTYMDLNAGRRCWTAISGTLSAFSASDKYRRGWSSQKGPLLVPGTG